MGAHSTARMTQQLPSLKLSGSDEFAQGCLISLSPLPKATGLGMPVVQRVQMSLVVKSPKSNWHCGFVLFVWNCDGCF